MIGDVVLEAEHAQRRAALAGAVERGYERVLHDLLRQRRAVDDHRILATGLGDQHRIVVAPGELADDPPRDIGRSREEHAGDPRIGDERRADRLPRARQELQRGARHARVVQHADRGVRDQRRLLGGLREHRVARRERGADLPREDREREVPRRDRDEGSERAASPSARASTA